MRLNTRKRFTAMLTVVMMILPTFACAEGGELIQLPDGSNVNYTQNSDGTVNIEQLTPPTKTPEAPKPVEQSQSQSQQTAPEPSPGLFGFDTPIAEDGVDFAQGTTATTLEQTALEILLNQMPYSSEDKELQAIIAQLESKILERRGKALELLTDNKIFNTKDVKGNNKTINAATYSQIIEKMQPVMKKNGYVKRLINPDYKLPKAYQGKPYSNSLLSAVRLGFLPTNIKPTDIVTMDTLIWNAPGAFSIDDFKYNDVQDRYAVGTKLASDGKLTKQEVMIYLAGMVLTCKS